LCKCTVDVTEALPDSVIPIGITVYQQADHFQNTDWSLTSGSAGEKYAPSYIHVTFPLPSSGGAAATEGRSFSNSEEVHGYGGGPTHNTYDTTSHSWSAFPTTKTSEPLNDSNAFGFPNPFETSSAFLGEFTLRLSMVNAVADATNPDSATENRKLYPLDSCSPYAKSPEGAAPESTVPPLIFRIDTTIDTSDSKGADPRSSPGTIAFTEVLLQEFLPGRTIALAQRGTVGVVGAEALMVEVQSWSQHSWVELRDRSGRVHRLSPSRPRIELPPNTGTIESLTWTYGSETPASPGTLGPTLRIRHRGSNTPSPVAAFRLSWRGLLEAANRAVGGPLSIPGFNPLPDWTALTFGLDGLAPGQEDPTLTLNTPLSGALFTLPLTPAPHHTFTWSIQNPYVQITGQLQEQRGPRLGVWVDEARVSSPFGDLTLLPTHVLVEMDHVGRP
jgi:hypothetical protein